MIPKPPIKNLKHSNNLILNTILIIGIFLLLSKLFYLLITIL